jgi:hypothetical protein
MSPKAKAMIFGSLKSSAAIAIGAVTAIHLADPAVFNFHSWAGILHMLKTVGLTVLVTEARYGWQWANAWAAKNPPPVVPPAA